VPFSTKGMIPKDYNPVRLSPLSLREGDQIDWKGEGSPIFLLVLLRENDEKGGKKSVVYLLFYLQRETEVLFF